MSSPAGAQGAQGAQGAHGARAHGAGALTVEDLVAGYGHVLALDKVTITAGAGTITAVLGANGAGKTTLLRAVSGMVRPRGGRVLLDGTDQAGRGPEYMARAGIAHVPEGQGVIAELTVEENLRIGMMSWPGISRRRTERAAALAGAYERFSVLADRRRKLAATLSGGERQMLVIARALMAGPRVLLLDEPSLGLAPRVVAQVMALTADAGTITAVLGANGAGKTTLLRAISGMVRPRGGRVLLDGTDRAGRGPEDMARAGVAHVPEGQGVIAELTVEENLRLGLMSWPGIARRRTERAAALTDAYERFSVLADRRRRLAATLSGGERQMLVIARALIARPRVLLLDEPSLGLAPRVMAQVMDTVVRLSKESGITVVLVEQNARAALAIADHGVVLNLGRVVATADAKALAADVALRHHYLGF